MPKFIDVVGTARADLNLLVEGIFPVRGEVRAAWTTPDQLTELSLGVEQEMIFARYRCGEPKGETLDPHHYTIKASEFRAGVFDWSDYEIELPEMEHLDELEQESFWERCSGLDESLVRIALAVALADLASHLERCPIATSPDTVFHVYDRLEDPLGSFLYLSHRLRDEEAEQIILELCGGDTIAAFIAALEADSSATDAATQVLQVLDSHAIAKKTLLG